MTDQEARASETIAPETRSLLDAAARFAAAARPDAGDAGVAEFAPIYREWIMNHRGMNDDPALWAERWRLRLHCMAAASTLDEATDLLMRFSNLLGDPRETLTLRDEGHAVAIVIDEPLRTGQEGLIVEIWPLALALCELEFLAGGPLPGIHGRVRNRDCLPPGVANLLFGRALSFDAPELALVIPKRHLRRAVVVRAADISAFVRQVMPALLGSRQGETDLPTQVASLLRDYGVRGEGSAADLPRIAAALGCSPATLRRHLQASGTQFRLLKETVFDELAKSWLRESDVAIDTIAERLGYSDTSALRRSFRRRNGCSPQAFRSETAMQDVAGD
jgi:AraC-like DNA-binding protein